MYDGGNRRNRRFGVICDSSHIPLYRLLGYLKQEQHNTTVATNSERESEQEALSQVITTSAIEDRITQPSFDPQFSTAPVLKRKRGRPPKNANAKKARAG